MKRLLACAAAMLLAGIAGGAFAQLQPISITQQTQTTTQLVIENASQCFTLGPGDVADLIVTPAVTSTATASNFTTPTIPAGVQITFCFQATVQ